MKHWIKSFLPKPVWRCLSQSRERWFKTYATRSYSQEGEDMILERFLENRPSGFYVDVGAHHPKRFSNTYRLYQRGWRGLNIDATPGSMAIFRRLRPRDINIEAAVSSRRQKLTYYMFDEPALNTFDRESALANANEIYSLIDQVTLETSPLSQLLDEHVPAGTKIDLLTVDVEGMDYDVLKSNDWERHSPEFILVECLDCPTVDQASSAPIARLLADEHYSIVAKTKNTVLFKLMPTDPSRQDSKTLMAEKISSA